MRSTPQLDRESRRRTLRIWNTVPARPTWRGRVIEALWFMWDIVLPLMFGTLMLAFLVITALVLLL